MSRQQSRRLEELRSLQKVKQSSSASVIERKTSVVPVQREIHKYVIVHPDDSQLKKLPPLYKAKGSYIDILLIQKIQQCSLIYDFWDETSNPHGKKSKTETLNEILEWITRNDCRLKEPVITEFMEMISINIFRPIVVEDKVSEDDDTENAYEEVSWPHLELVYQIFDTLVKFNLIKRKHIKESFLVQLMGDFNSPDKRERDVIKNILQRIYLNQPLHRRFIRQQITCTFLKFIYETNEMIGIKDMLELYAIIVAGLTLPLKKEYITTLQKVLIPLHVPPNLHTYHGELVSCIVTFIEKDRELAKDVLRGLVKYWPRTCSMKEIAFLNEVEAIISTIQYLHDKEILGLLFEQLALSACSINFTVGQRALLMYKNNSFTAFIMNYLNQIMPIVVPHMYKMARSHWNTTTQSLMNETLEFYRTANAELFEECKNKEPLSKKREKLSKLKKINL